MSIIWLGALIAFSILEAVTFGLASIWFAAGALVALIISVLDGPIWLQIVSFLVVSFATMLLVRPLARKYLTPRNTRTNADRVIGAEGVVTETIRNLDAAGLVSVGGNIWSARSENGEELEKGTLVRVLRTAPAAKSE
jgi:membrane protein implicated in regulation of membrane protease activity